jgi:hypothetical protein
MLSKGGRQPPPHHPGDGFDQKEEKEKKRKTYPYHSVTGTSSRLTCDLALLLPHLLPVSLMEKVVWECLFLGGF